MLAFNVKKFIWIVSLILLAAIIILQYFPSAETAPIRIGIIHSLSGTMTTSESPMVNVLQTGVDKINAQGGLLGRRLETIVVDTRSDAEVAAAEAERLIVEEKVDALFGCWTSSCRKAVKPIVEKYDRLLFYPVQYEGMEKSPNIIYTGSAPNQQIIPGVNWALTHLGKRVYIVGSDYIFPRIANIIISDIAKIKNAEVLAARYAPLGSDDFDGIISEIKKIRPTVIFNTINGNSNEAFFLKKHQAGLDSIPVVSFSLAEVEMEKIQVHATERNYSVWNYFQSIATAENKAFLAEIESIFGDDDKVLASDPMEASYIGLQLWVRSVRSAGSTDSAAVKYTLKHTSLRAPEGLVSVDSENNHLRRNVRIGRARPDGQFDIVWESSGTIVPVPFPSYRSQDEWNDMVKEVSEGMGL